MKSITCILMAGLICCVTAINIYALNDGISGLNADLSDSIREGGDYRYYWILGQVPDWTNVYLYAKDGAVVTFNGSVDEPVSLTVPDDELVSYNVGTDLGFVQSEVNWFFMEMASDRPLMVIFDRAVYLLVEEDTYEWVHGDPMHNMPHMELSTIHYMDGAVSGTIDDILVVYAHEPTQVTVRGLLYNGVVVSETFTVAGLQKIIGSFRHFFLASGDVYNCCYSLMITAENPIAALLADERPWWPDNYADSGYYFSMWRSIIPELHNEYMAVQLGDPSFNTHSFYTLTANEFEYYDYNGDLVGSLVHPGEHSGYVYYSDVGYAGSPYPYLTHVLASAPFVESRLAPTAVNIIDVAGYIGWNADLGVLEIFADQDAHIQIYDGRNCSLLTEFDMTAGTIYIDNAVDIGFDAGEPFLAVVSSDVPVYQIMKDSDSLRPYPAELAPDCLGCTPGENEVCQTGLPGVCDHGTTLCLPDSTWGDCLQDVEASEESQKVDTCNDMLDNDCDGLVDCNDPDCRTNDCDDPDGDGYGNPASRECVFPERDCDNSDPFVNAGIAEHFGSNDTDGIDNDCDGTIDETCFIDIVM